MQVLIVTKNGLGIKIDSDSFPVFERGSAGVKAINLKDGDEVVAVIPANEPPAPLAVI